MVCPFFLDFVKPADASQNDKRRGLQLATAAAADSGRLLWNVPTIISPLPLIKMIDMLGFEDSKPGPSARAEQSLCCVEISKALTFKFCLVASVTVAS